MRNRNLDNRKEDYLVDLTIIPYAGHSDESSTVIKHVRCKVYLPQKVTDSISLVFHLNKDQYHLLRESNLWRFSIEGEENHVPGHRTRFSAQKVYRVNLSATHWYPDIIDALLIAEPVDLKREHFRSRDESEKVLKTYGRFWLTPNKLLTPGQSIGHSYTGEVEVETVWKVEFNLENGLPITFTNRYRYRDNDEDETISWSELVAEYELEGKAQNFEDVYSSLNDLDDLLRIASLAARHSCVCLGFDISTTEGYIVDFYRRGISIPAQKAKRYDELIDIANIKEFLDVAYHKFIELGRNDLIRQAINYTIPREGRTIESSFITLYSALETLVLYFRRNAKLEMVFSEDEGEQWKHFQRILRQLFKRHPILRNDKTRRMRLYDNIPALRRVSFRTAFLECYRTYGVDISDLWPVIGSNEGWSLSIIRNKLVHGEHFNSAQRHAVGAARSHLQWTVERLLLTILGWDISKSYVESGYLSRNLNDYKNWQSDLRILSS